MAAKVAELMEGSGGLVPHGVQVAVSLVASGMLIGGPSRRWRCSESFSNDWTFSHWVARRQHLIRGEERAGSDTKHSSLHLVTVNDWGDSNARCFVKLGFSCLVLFVI